MRLVKAPNARDNCLRPTIFLGGSIEMGAAVDWQTHLSNSIEDIECTIWNPRNNDWDPTWDHDPTPGSNFRNQVNWELEGQDDADIIIYYFDPATKAPITMMELGLFIGKKEILVCCPDGFWKKGNIVAVCDRYDVPLWHTYHEFVADFRKYLVEEWGCLISPQ